MDTSKARELLEGGPDTTVAFAPEKSSALSLAETLIALANAEGGTLILGVTEAGAVRGVRDAELVRDRVLSAALHITPPLVLAMPEQAIVENRALLVVDVPRGLPNVYATDGRYLIRDGGGNRPLQAAEIHQLMVRRGIADFETQTPPGTGLGDLDWDRVRVYAENLGSPKSTDLEGLLRIRACLVEEDHQLRPTFAGLLLFGHTPWLRIPQAEITAVRYPGREMGDQFLREDIRGPLPDQIHRASAFLKENTSYEVTLGGLAHQERPAYPEDVLREVVVNAVAHRDYAIRGDNIRLFIFSDRVEVYSPGPLPGHITVENIVQERFSRNPVLVQVLADVGFVERLGYGIDRMLRSLAEAGLPAPHFEETAAGFQVTLYRKPEKPIAPDARWSRLELNPRQEIALGYAIEHQRITNRDYQSLCPDVSSETIRRDLSDLVDKDILLRIGRKRATYYILKDATLRSVVLPGNTKFSWR